MTGEASGEFGDLIDHLAEEGRRALAAVPEDVPKNSTRWIKANALLALLHEPGIYPEWEPGSFEGAIMRAGLAADQTNLRWLQTFWPHEMEVVRLYKDVPGGYQRLQRWARGEGKAEEWD